MRILVYGAGVLGGNLANNLFHAKQDVTLLARGKRAETIQQNGLIVCGDCCDFYICRMRGRRP